MFLVERVLLGGLTFGQLGRTLGASPQSVGRRFRLALELLVRLPLPPLPTDDGFVLLVDGLWFTFRKRYWVFYDMAVKPVHSNTVCFLEPVILPGIEHYRAWRRAVSTLPLQLRHRVRALVSDGFRGAALLARDNGWLHQRCHFHLMALLRSRLGRRPSYGGKDIREGIYRITREMLGTTAEQRLVTLGTELEKLAVTPACPARLGGAARQFLREGDSFRTYLLHPELMLPTTVSTLESRHSLIRRLAGRVNNPASLLMWLQDLTRLRPIGTCNGYRNPQE